MPNNFQYNQILATTKQPVKSIREPNHEHAVSSQAKLEAFDIRNFIERLEPAKEKNKYVCPACGGNNLSIKADTGAYKCWNGCDEKDVREAIRPWSEVVGSPDTARTPIGRRRKPAIRSSAEPKPAPFSQGEIALIRCNPTPLPTPQIPQWKPIGVPANAEEIIYRYSPTQFVHRFQWVDETKPKGRDKAFRQRHLNGDGLPEWSKGPELWPAHREQEALNALASFPADVAPVLLIQEGEGCVHIALEIGLVSVTFQGSAWNRADIERFLKAVLAASPRTIIVSLADTDATGEKKAQVVSESCNSCGVPFVALSANIFLPTPQEKADIEEILINMTPEEFISRLEEEIRRAIDERSREADDTDASNKGFGEPQKKKLPLKDAAALARKIMGQKLPELEENLTLEEIRSECGMSSYDWTAKIIKPLKRDLEGERFKLELQGLLAIEDAIERLRQQALIAPRYSMNSATLEKALQIMKVKQGTPETRVWSLDDFLDQTSEGLNWLIPGFLPKGETILLIGAPKCGKSLLAVDAAFAVATGDEFLGETCEEGRVLVVSVDESANSTKNKLLKRGFRRQDAANVRVIDKWDISQLSTLEAVMEDFRPTLVIVDSLKRITHGSEVSENSAEFADNIYALKEIFTRYSASGILVHHAKKDKDAYGVDMARGSSAIAGATWGQWQIKQIPKPDPDNPKRLIVDPSDPERSFYVHSRDIEGEVLTLHFNPDNNSYENLGGKEMGSKEEELHRGQQESLIRDRIMRVLRLNDPTPLSGRQIIELMELTKEEGRSVYTTLGRMVGKRVISSFPAPGDKRYNLYSLPHPTKDSSNNTPPENRGFSTPPPSPPPTVSTVDYSAENYTPIELGDTQQLVNNYTTDSQHPFSAEIETSCTVSVWSDSKLDNTPTQKGGEGGKNSSTVAVECDSQCTTNQPDSGEWTIEGAIATASANEGDAIVGLAPLGLDGIAPTSQDLATLTADLLATVADNALDMFNALRELYPVRWLQLAAHQIRLNHSAEFEVILEWLKAPTVPASELPTDRSDVLIGEVPEVQPNLSAEVVSDVVNDFPEVGDLVWRSPIPSEWNARTKQRKPAQPGCLCRIIQVNNHGAIALCESDGSRFHVSWHAWQSGLFVPYCGQDGK